MPALNCVFRLAFANRESRRQTLRLNTERLFRPYSCLKLSADFARHASLGCTTFERDSHLRLAFLLGSVTLIYLRKPFFPAFVARKASAGLRVSLPHSSNSHTALLNALLRKCLARFLGAKIHFIKLTVTRLACAKGTRRRVSVSPRSLPGQSDARQTPRSDAHSIPISKHFCHHHPASQFSTLLEPRTLNIPLLPARNNCYFINSTEREIMLRESAVLEMICASLVPRRLSTGLLGSGRLPTNASIREERD